jgi:(2Fe-2S) ferredoxin
MGKKEKRANKEQQEEAGIVAAFAPTKKPKKLHNTVRPYVQHILVCTDSKSKACKKGGPTILKAFQRAIKERKLHRRIIVSEIGHIGGCSLGPNVIVYPDGVWYGTVDERDVDEIIDRHLLGGEVVAHLLRGARKDDPCHGCALVSPPTPELMNVA